MSQAFRIQNYQRPVNLPELTSKSLGQAVNTGKSEKGSESFQAILNGELGAKQGITFSKHAAQRLHSRKIELSDDQLNRISDGIDKAEHKGSRETLILADDTAMVVSVKNRTVVTVFDKDHLREGVVTSIDSAVII